MTKEEFIDKLNNKIREKFPTCNIMEISGYLENGTRFGIEAIMPYKDTEIKITTSINYSYVNEYGVEDICEDLVHTIEDFMEEN